MRLWSIHPKYLDTKGLLALWREGLLAKAVLTGKTKGYKNHPQLDRFYKTQNPICTLYYYLSFIYFEARVRGYNFNLDKISRIIFAKAICGEIHNMYFLQVSKKQLEYEYAHLMKKLEKRDYHKFKELLLLGKIEPNPLFKVVKGNIAEWEKVGKEYYEVKNKILNSRSTK